MTDFEKRIVANGGIVKTPKTVKAEPKEAMAEVIEKQEEKPVKKNEPKR